MTTKNIPAKNTRRSTRWAYLYWQTPGGDIVREGFELDPNADDGIGPALEFIGSSIKRLKAAGCKPLRVEQRTTVYLDQSMPRPKAST